MSYWTIAHGDPDVTGIIFWCGYERDKKEHRFSRNLTEAIRFHDEDSARRAGVGLTKGVKFVKYDQHNQFVRETR